MSNNPTSLPTQDDATLLPALYDTDRWFWWSVGMRRITHALLHAHPIPPRGAVLEIGCGGGTFLSELARRYPERAMIGMDLNRVALANARSRYGERLALGRTDLHYLPLADHSCALVVALDVFDQRAVRLPEALAEAWRVLRPEGLLLLRVSAYPWLLGPHDRAFGTGRRYARAPFRAAIEEAGFTIQRLTHANSLLLLPAIAARLAQRRGSQEVEEQLSVPAPLNTLLRGVLGSEAALLQKFDLPAGLSLCALARKG